MIRNFEVENRRRMYLLRFLYRELMLPTINWESFFKRFHREMESMDLNFYEQQQRKLIIREKRNPDNER